MEVPGWAGPGTITAMVSSRWPMTHLRLQTPALELRWPSLDDLDALAELAAAGVHDPSVQPQGQGIGTQMRAAVLQLAFQGLGAQQAVSAAFEGNPASLRVSRKLGYRDDLEWHVVRGRPALTRRLRLARADWQAARTIPAQIHGL